MIRQRRGKDAEWWSEASGSLFTVDKEVGFKYLGPVNADWLTYLVTTPLLIT